MSWEIWRSLLDERKHGRWNEKCFKVDARKGNYLTITIDMTFSCWRLFNFLTFCHNFMGYKFSFSTSKYELYFHNLCHFGRIWFKCVDFYCLVRTVLRDFYHFDRENLAIAWFWSKHVTLFDKYVNFTYENFAPIQGKFYSWQLISIKI